MLTIETVVEGRQFKLPFEVHLPAVAFLKSYSTFHRRIFLCCGLEFITDFWKLTFTGCYIYLFGYLVFFETGFFFVALDILELTL